MCREDDGTVLEDDDQVMVESALARTKASFVS
jgi:hypothetical protein